MFDLSKKYDFDPNKEVDGVWEQIEGGASLLIARMGNLNFQKAYGKIPKAMQLSIDNKTIEDEDSGIILSNILAKTILLNWKGVGENKKELKYSEKSAAEYLLKYPDFRSLVIDLSNDLEKFHRDEVVEDSKN